MKKLVSGHARFRQDGFQQHKPLFDELAKGQSPEVLFVTCADSRIDPHMITQTLPGDLFVCRNAGNIVPPQSNDAGGENASIEFAVMALGVKDIVICGHSECGAMKGAMNMEGVTSLPHVHDWLHYARAAVDTVEARGVDDADKLMRVTEQNVLLQLQHVQTLPSVAAKVNNGEIGLHGWVYHIGSGEVTCYDEGSKRFVPLQERYASLM